MNISPEAFWGLEMKNMAINQEQQQQTMDNIGNALTSIGSAYTEIEGNKAKGRAFKKTLEVIGPALGMTTDKLKAVFGDLKNDMDYFKASETMMPMMPSLINATLGQSRLGVTQQGQQLATDRMYTQEQLRRERDAINNPPPPQPMTLPQGIRRFNTGTTQGS